ncbi:glyoxalase [Streptomyces echinatus]|uniref:Catechol 2,3-dioxygenase-like lactoylglutathione lyase family enzyme n=1 Tax=Streptomyces echinatus TaxID=67293 RepID=A0A7W9UQ62_9ACTN|nr:glyoxalase [Streptomyces echinatus]MBB5926611.1 catechol 2,3-dioxygenase-like lactoylglutathione lyase family enzyme [Streptomyces echinatus]
MNPIDAVTLEVADLAAVTRFYSTVLGPDSPHLRLRATEAATTGFRGFTLSLVVSQPGNADALIKTALDAGATLLKPATKTLWGYGGVLQAPDGTIIKIATSAKKNTTPVTPDFDEFVLLLGVQDVKATKQYYTDRGLNVGRSFGSKYVEFTSDAGHIKLALYKRRALAKDAGVPDEGTGSHRLVLSGTAGPCNDPDDFIWEAGTNSPLTATT